MSENIVSNIKEISSPKDIYYGEWLLDGEGLRKISTIKKGKKLYDEFLKRYYYLPLSVVFKDEDLAKDFKASIISKLVEGKRKMYFSKKVFLSNIVYNIDEVIKDDESYRLLKKAIRCKKDMYRDVFKLGESSSYYNEILNEYKLSGSNLSFEKYIVLCKKKFTRLLTGYNTVLEMLDKPVNVNKLLECFSPDQFYLYVCYSILVNSEKEYDLYGKVDINISELDKYKKIVKEKRKSNSFYNTCIVVGNEVVVTIDDLFKKYDALLEKVGK